MKARILSALVLTLLAALISGCDSKHGNSSNAEVDLPVASVSIQTVESKSRVTTEEVVATVRARLHATIEAKLNGRIEQMPVVLGDRIEKGRLIARLDAAEIAARLEQAEAAQEQAEREWKRVSNLFEQRIATQSEQDSAQAKLRLTKAMVAEAKTMMGYVEILSPFDGVVTKKWADVGDLAVPGKPLIEIENPAVLQLDAEIPEAIADRIQRGAQMTVRADGLRSDLSAVVSEVAPAADTISRTFRVKLDLPKPDGLKSGQFARLIVPMGESNSLRVPASAVIQHGQLEIVFVADNKRARMHLVKTGKRLGDEVEILSGLDSGDAVIVSEVAQLTDGQPVEAK